MSKFVQKREVIISVTPRLKPLFEIVNQRVRGCSRHPPHLLTPGQALDLTFNSYYVAGCTSQKIYLANTMAPQNLIVTDYGLTDTVHAKLNLPGQIRLIRGAATIAVDSPFVFLAEGVSPRVLSGNLSDLSLCQVEDTTTFFLSSVPISKHAFALRVYDGKSKSIMLAKKTFRSRAIDLKKGILTKQVDGIFCTDGMLNCNAASNTVIYLYYYRNEIIVMDTTLHVRFKASTIDTITHAKISVSTILADSTITLNAPPLKVNKKSCLSGQYLFVNSALMADNEEENTFQNCSVIDVYTPGNGEYKFSFYLPDFNGYKVSDFAVAPGSTFIAIHNNFLITYSMNF